jgi:DNA-binding NarL/FixJ family response regulator
LACQLLSRALTGSGTRFKVVGYAQTKEELLKEVSEHRPDVAIVNSLLQDDPQGV